MVTKSSDTLTQVYGTDGDIWTPYLFIKQNGKETAIALSELDAFIECCQEVRDDLRRQQAGQQRRPRVNRTGRGVATHEPLMAGTPAAPGDYDAIVTHCTGGVGCDA
jgi:hypothetical protein